MDAPRAQRTAFLFYLIALLQTLMCFAPTSMASSLELDGLPRQFSEMRQEALTLRQQILSLEETLTDEQRSELEKTLQFAQGQLQSTFTLLNKRDRLQSLLTQEESLLTDAEAVETLQKRIQDLPTLDLDALSALLDQGERVLGKLKQEQAAIDTQLADFLKLAKSGAGRVNTLKKRLSDMPHNTGGELISSTAPLDKRLSGLHQHAEHLLLTTEMHYIEWVTGNLARLSAKLEEKRAKTLTLKTAVSTALESVRDQLYALRQQQANLKVQNLHSQQALGQSSPLLSALQSDIESLLNQNQRYLAREQQLDNERLVVTQTVQQLEGDFERVKHLLAIGGRTERVSRILRGKRSLVAASKRGAKPLLSYQESLNDIMFKIFDLEAELKEIGNADAFLETRATNRDHQLSDSDRTQGKAMLAEYREAGRALLETLRRQAGQLAELERLSAALNQTTERYEDFLNKTVLWLPSDSVNLIDDYHTIFPGLLNVFSAERWASLLSALPQQWRQNLWWVLVLVGVIALRRFRGRLKALIAETAELIKRPSTDRWRHTLVAVAASFAVAAPLPAFAIIIGLIFYKSPTTIFDANELGQGFIFFGALLFFCQVTRALLLPEGFFVKHMRWPARIAEAVRYELGWLRWLLPLSALVGQIALASPQQEGAVGVSRLAFILSLSLILIAIYRIFRSKGVLLSHLNESTSNWLAYYVVWSPFLLLIPITLLIGVIAGYYYTAIYISEKIMLSVAIVLGLVLCRAVCMRYLYVIKRQYRYQEIMASYRARQSEQSAASTHDATAVQSDADATTQRSAETLALEEEENIDFKALSHQADSLVRMVFWVCLVLLLGWLWTDLFVAVTEIDQLISGAEGGDISDPTSFTFGRIITGILLAVVAIFMARNLPGLLELVILQRLPLIAGTKYAITTIVQYIIVLMGIVLVSRVFGIQWSNIQWLVAALSVGLGFGLQEIVANFISGIILLFEQPIRVGDIITINGVSGVVSRIRIRATTIINWDKQEFIMPNKTFITGELTNWTLTDTLNRLVFNVGIAYGSDVERALEILRDIARERPDILEDPEPLVTFDAFGDNALLVVARMYLASLENRLNIKTEINVEINKRFNEAGIVIAFPQRDVHLDTSKPLEISFTNAKAKPMGS